jgi:hypothetical protein
MAVEEGRRMAGNQPDSGDGLGVAAGGVRSSATPSSSGGSRASSSLLCLVFRCLAASTGRREVAAAAERLGDGRGERGEICLHVGSTAMWRPT